MNTAVIHRRVVSDMDALIDEVSEILPVRMPKVYETREVNMMSFLKRLNRVTERHRIYNERAFDPSLPLGITVTSGIWIPKEELPENGSSADIRLIWYTHPKVRRLPMTPLKWDRRRTYFWQRVGHELVHRHQHQMRMPDGTDARTYRVRSKNRELKETQEYYGNYDELEAHAYDAAIELMAWCPGQSFKEAVSTIESVTGNAIIPTYTTYLSAWEPTHPSVIPFKRKVRSWWDCLQKTPEFYAKLSLPRLL